MAAVTVSMSGDDVRLRAAHERLLADQQKLLDKYAKMSGASKQASADELQALAVKKRVAETEKANQAIMEQGRKLTQQMATPQEEFNQAVKQAIALKEKGAISGETLSRVYKKLKQELRDATGETKRLEQAQKEEQAAVAKAASITERYKTNLERLKSQLAEVKQEYDAGRVSLETLNRAQAEVNQEQEKIADAGKFNKAAAGIAGVTAAVAVLKQMWNDTYEAEQRALQQLDKNQEGDRNLAQIATSTEDYQRLQKLADRFAMASGVTPESARGIVFDAVSNGFESSLDAMAKSSLVVNPEDTAKLSIKIKSMFPGVTPEQAASAALSTTAQSDLNYSQVSSVLPILGEGGLQINATIDESLAALGVLSGKFKTAETTAERIKRFASDASKKPELAKGGLISAVEGVMAMSEEDRSKFLGDSMETKSAYLALSTDIEKIKEARDKNAADIRETAAGRGALAEKVALVSADETAMAVLRKRQQEQALAVTETSTMGKQGATAEATRLAVSRDTVGNPITRTLGHGIDIPFVTENTGFKFFGTADVASMATRLGMSPELSRQIGTGVLKAPFVPFGATPNADQINQSIRVDDSGLKEAASEMLEAATLMKQSASQMIKQQPSLVDSARAQAARASE